MTNTPPEQESAHKDGPLQPIDTLHTSSASLHPERGTMSDNDLSEKPVREKLKKTSIASISQHATKGQEGTQVIDDRRMSNCDVSQLESTPVEAINNTKTDPSRGRPLKKRSFDGLEITDTYEDTDVHKGTYTERPNGHGRKRSRDIRTDKNFKEDRLPRGVESTLKEDTEDCPALAGSPRAAGYSPSRTEAITLRDLGILQKTEVERATNHKDVGTAEERSSSEIGEVSPDQEMPDSVLSPRKKRSRDQFDAEADREQKQKIPATEGLRAQRKSDGLERKEDKRASSEMVLSREGSTPFEQEPKAVNNDSSMETQAAKKAAAAPFGSTSILSPLSKNTRSASPAKLSPNAQSQTSTAAFASSGFAALASSTTSPFGTLGASAKPAATPSPFAPSMAFATAKGDTSENNATNGAQPTVSGGLGASATLASSSSGAAGSSPFGTTGATKNSVFGGSVFGTGFGGFGGGNKLANFAAPTGDARLATANGAIKPIGSPNHEGDEGDGSNDEGLAEDENDGADEVDARFQHKDVETGENDEVTVFSSRASLYTFKDRAWKEGGKGGFKLNVKCLNGNQSPKSGRFIMRAHQTFRVLLNAPVLKGMTIGDHGKEPNGKSFQFAAIEDGKVVPHLLKLGETESKALYHEVKKLQHNMSED